MFDFPKLHFKSQDHVVWHLQCTCIEKSPSKSDHVTAPLVNAFQSFLKQALVLTSSLFLCLLVTNSELERIDAAFKRHSGQSSMITKNSFLELVLSENVPTRLAEV